MRTVEEVLPGIIEFRRERHRIPEIAGEEFAEGVMVSGMIPSTNFSAFSGAVRDLTGGVAIPREDPSDA